jgi:hypothetical protein
MANLALTPNLLPGGLSIYNVTSNASSPGANTGVTFTNDGQSFLIFVNGTTASTATMKIASTVEGQGVANATATIPVSATSVLGPFNADFSAGFGGTVEVDLSSTTGLTVLLAKYLGTH